MTPPDLTADLPPPRDDEPGGLRSDIVDELGDHLACAMHREQVLGAARGETTPEAVWPRVVEKFGNPRAVARRLWFDAMWEKIMNQRILTVFSVVMTSLAMFAIVLCWRIATQSQVATNAILEELKKLRTAPSQQPREWISLVIHCPRNSKDGPPAEGVRVTCQSSVNNLTGSPPRTITIGANGLADFGQLHYGEYELQFNVGPSIERKQTISLQPNEDQRLTVVCPEPNATAEIQFKIDCPPDDIPAELAEQICYVVGLESDNPKSDTWIDMSQFGDGILQKSEYTVFFKADGQCCLWPPDLKPIKQEFTEGPSIGGGRGGGGFLSVSAIGPDRKLYRSQFFDSPQTYRSPPKTTATLRVPLGAYRTGKISLCSHEGIAEWTLAYFSSQPKLILPVTLYASAVEHNPQAIKSHFIDNVTTYRQPLITKATLRLPLGRYHSTSVTLCSVRGGTEWKLAQFGGPTQLHLPFNQSVRKGDHSYDVPVKTNFTATAGVQTIKIRQAGLHEILRLSVAHPEMDAVLIDVSATDLADETKEIAWTPGGRVTLAVSRISKPPLPILEGIETYAPRVASPGAIVIFLTHEEYEALRLLVKRGATLVVLGVPNTVPRGELMDWTRDELADPPGVNLRKP